MMTFYYLTLCFFMGLLELPLLLPLYYLCSSFLLTLLGTMTLSSSLHLSTSTIHLFKELNNVTTLFHPLKPGSELVFLFSKAENVGR